ncbi:hypothetical protein M0Q97_08465 [Candidatus Dojkabacteria bacterium]|jgi:hypothetical protein|nr:hypothetical protein [Candidatus Dojkabacteria bacterium]
MIINFNQYIQENVLNLNDENENKWEISINDVTYDKYKFKYDAILGILEILDNSDLGLDDYEDNDGTEYYDLSEIADMLNNLDESDFYKKLDDLKTHSNYGQDIKLINLNDDNELEFLKKNN